ncbi:interleukin-17 receptor B isoform X2 [Pseudorasbora parva]|uniref:interleukin-17 receptor B isoform X2 n=1 Tax=Pseudorasbora parva TaxID=51549 RepID=UPI00351E91F8
MALLNLLRVIAAVMALIHWTDSHSIVATCLQQNRTNPPEYFVIPLANPSPILNVSAELNESQSVLTVKWAIKVDASIHTLTGTWIKTRDEEPKYYRCEYQPPFTSGEIRHADLEQLWFSFTVPNVTLCPSTQLDISAYNLPTPPPGTGVRFIKSATVVQSDWSADIHSVFHDDKIVVTFKASSAADTHTITLSDKTGLLNTVEKKGGCNVEECRVELENLGPCEDLLIEITPHFEYCSDEMAEYYSVLHEVNCTNTSGLAIGVVCVLTLLFMLLCCCIICQVLRWVRGSKRGMCVRVLLVYPAVDGVFQRAVMSLAQLLQSRSGVTVAIDVWDRGSLAKQGPLRWINTQAELADRVLIISPPQRSKTDDHKSLISDMTDDTVSASASDLFTLTLNLVSSAAHDPHGRDKFWVINLQHDEKSVQTELRGCRTFILPREEEKLHQQLTGTEIQSLALMTCFSSFFFRHAPEHMKTYTDFPTCAEVHSLDETSDLLL